MMYRVMFTFVFFYNLNTIHADNIAFHDKYNVALVDETGFKIDMQFNDSDYEMINENEIINSHIKYPDERFLEFHKIARAEYEKSKFHRDLIIQLTQAKAQTRKPKTDNKTIITSSSPTIQVTAYLIHKRSAVVDDDDDDDNDEEKKNATSISVQNVTLVELSEPADQDDITLIPIQNVSTIEAYWVKFKEVLKENSVLNANYNCTEEDLRGIGLKAIKCTLIEFEKGQILFGFLVENLIEIISIWLLVYFIFALPLWCTKGWCSCCLCCKFFKPQQTIQEAKKYLLLNPPGTLVTKKGGIIHYEPTERERDCYEEFGHFMRTL